MFTPKVSRCFSKLLGIVPKTPTTIGIIFAKMFSGKKRQQLISSSSSLLQLPKSQKYSEYEYFITFDLSYQSNQNACKQLAFSGLGPMESFLTEC